MDRQRRGERAARERADGAPGGDPEHLPARGAVSRAVPAAAAQHHTARGRHAAGSAAGSAEPIDQPIEEAEQPLRLSGLGAGQQRRLLALHALA